MYSFCCAKFTFFNAAITSRLLRCTYVAILFLLSITTSFAASFSNYTIADGLSQSIVFSIAQDETGYMWFATQDGLNRFDGNRFLVFKSSEQSANALADNYIYPLISDPYNNLWLGTRSAGVDKLSLETYLFEHFSAANTQLMQNRISTLHYFDEKIWIGTYHGDLHYYDLKTQSLSAAIVNLNKPIYAILADSQQQLWLGTHGNGLIIYDLNSQIQTHYLATPDKNNGLQHNSVFSILQDSKQRIWVGTQGGGLHQFINKQQGFKHWQHDSSNASSISHNEVRTVFQDKQDRIWIGTRGGGLNLYQEDSDSFTHFTHDPTNQYSLAHNRVYSIFQDNNNIMWIGTANGVSKFDPKSLVFEHLKAPDVLSNNDIWSLFEDSHNNLWIGSWGGGLDKLQADHNDSQAHASGIKTGSTKSNAIKSIIEDDKQKLWVGTRGKGLETLDLVTGESKQYIADNEDVYSLSNNNVFSLLIDNKKQLWIGTDGGGLNKFDAKSQRFSHAQNSSETVLNIASKKIFSLYQDSTGQYWIGTDGHGIYRYNDKKGVLQQFSTHSSSGQKTSHNTIRSIHEDDDGNIWFGTSNGLNRFDKQTEQIQRWGMNEGLPNQVIYAIETGQEHEIWLSTNKGISRYDRKHNSFTNFRQIDGIQGDEFNADASVKLANGRLAFGGNNGVTLFTPSDVKSHTSVGNIALTSLLLDHKPVYPQINDNLSWYQSLNSAKQSIALDYAIDRLSLSFSYLKYVKPQTTTFKYRLLGFDKNWQLHRGEYLNLEYTNLDAGQYQLEVVASQVNEHLTSKPLLLVITVSPAPWHSWWAYLTYISLIMLSIILYIHLRTLKVEQQNKVLEKLVQQRTEEIAKQQTTITAQSVKLQQTLNAKNSFFTNVSHELRTPLSLIIAPLQRLIAMESDQQKQQNLSLVLRNGERLKTLVNKLLSLSHSETIKKNPLKLVNLSATATKTAQQFQSSYANNPIDFNFNIEDNIYVLANEEGLESIITNLVANSFKYTKQGYINLTIKKQVTNQVLMTVVDSGIGISEQQQELIFEPFNRGNNAVKNIEGSGIGLAIVHDLCQQFNADITVTSALNSGCSFQLIFTEADVATTRLSTAISPKNDKVKANTTPSEQFKNTKTVLIVEDNLDLSDFLYHEFNDKYKVLQANNGVQGLELAKAELPDLIISDIMMPEMDGITMLEQINRHPMTCHIPVILLTAKDDKSTKLQGLNAHALDFIAKPFDHHELQIKVYNWLVWTEQIAQKYILGEQIQNQTLNAQDEKFISKLHDLLAQHFSNCELEIDFIAKEMAVSLRQLQRKIKALTSQSPIEYLRNYRIQNSQKLLAQGIQISLVASQVGFNSSSYFAKTFKAKYHLSPKEYQQKFKSN